MSVCSIYSLVSGFADNRVKVSLQPTYRKLGSKLLIFIDLLTSLGS